MRGRFSIRFFVPSRLLIVISTAGRTISAFAAERKKLLRRDDRNETFVPSADHQDDREGTWQSAAGQGILDQVVNVIEIHFIDARQNLEGARRLIF